MSQLARSISNWLHDVAQQLGMDISELEGKLLEFNEQELQHPDTGDHLKKLGLETIRDIIKGARTPRAKTQETVATYIDILVSRRRRKGVLQDNQVIVSLQDYLTQASQQVINAPMSLSKNYTDCERRKTIDARYPGVYYAYRKASNKTVFRRDVLIFHSLHRSHFPITFVTSSHDDAEPFGIYRGYAYANNKILFMTLMHPANYLRFDAAVLYLNQVMNGPVLVMDGILMGTTTVGNSPMATPIILRRALHLEKRFKLDHPSCSEERITRLISDHDFTVKNTALDKKQREMLKDGEIVSAGVDKANQAFIDLNYPVSK